MATSGVITSTVTVDEVIRAALQEIHVLPAGETASGEDAQDALRVLNWMLKTWQADGLQGWRDADMEVVWPAATESATLDTNVHDLDAVRFRSSGIDRMLTRYSDREYAAIPNKSQAGDPLVYHVNKTRDTLKLKLWPVPASETTLYADASRVVEDVTALSQNIDAPQEWTETIVVCLAARLTTIHRVEPSLALAVSQRAADLYDRLMGFGSEPGSVFFA